MSSWSERKTREKRVFIETYGCQMNVYDSERIAGMLQRHQYQITFDLALADVIILNTCSIRKKPEHKIYSVLGRLRRLKENNPHIILSVGGCVAQQEGERLFEKAPHLDLVFGTQAVHRLPHLLERVQAEGKVCDVAMNDHDSTGEDDSRIVSLRVSAFVSIIRGCDNFCSFCVVPYVRGREKSRPEDKIIQEVRHLAEQGVKEITLLGQNVNSYGNDRGEKEAFPRLLAAVNRVKGIERIRFITSHPKDLSDELISCFKKLDKLCEHIHLPLQSGSNKILRLMNRHYTREQYLEKVAKLRRTCPQISITTDVIVGFPMETEEDFQDTLRVLREVGFDDLFSFEYSDRPMTAATRFEGKIAPEVKRSRLVCLQEVQKGYSLKRNAELIGRMEEVLVENVSKKRGGFMTGKTKSNKTVNFAGEERLRGRLVTVRITSASLHSLGGELLS